MLFCILRSHLYCWNAAALRKALCAALFRYPLLAVSLNTPVANVVVDYLVQLRQPFVLCTSACLDKHS